MRRAVAEMRWRWWDAAVFWAVAAFGVAALAALAVAPHVVLAAEDAVILFQYSRNLAHTGAISFVAGGPHAEGATDFAWMLLLAGGIKLHVPPLWMVALANVACLLWLPWLLARIAGVPLRLPFALFVMGAFALFPQSIAAAAGFSVLPFACLLALVALYFLRCRDTALALSCLALCLFRPDGVVFAVPLLLSGLLVREGRGRRALIFSLAFVAPGLVYFGWRWWYFGSLLPLPFLVKSDTDRVLGLIAVSSLEQGVFLCAFALLLIWVALRGKAVTATTRALMLCLVVLPNIFYFAMRLDQDAGHRFFVYLPLGAAVIIAAEWKQLREERVSLLRAGLVLWLIFVCKMLLNVLESGYKSQFDNRQAIARGLAALPHGFLLTTEAGVVPYYSRWPVYDAWGLNTATFARRLLQPADVSRLQPDLILLYTGGDRACVPGEAWQTPYASRTWQHMTRNLVAGIDRTKYELWYAPYADVQARRARGVQDWDGDQECWFVRRDAPQRAGVEDDLRQHAALPEAEYLARQPVRFSEPQAEKVSRLRVMLRTPYRWWKRLSS